MNEETKKSLESGEVFSLGYVQQLRQEAKENRLKAEKLHTDNTSAKDLADARLNVALEAERKASNKLLVIAKINSLCNDAGVKIDANQIYQDGKSAEDSFSEFTKKNPALFEKKSVEVNGIDFGISESAKTLTSGTLADIKKDAGARGMLSRVYQTLVQDDKQKSR